MPYTIWEGIKSGIIDWAMGTYSTLDPWTYPMIFAGVICFIYASMQSLIVAVVGIIITMSLFGTTVFVGVPDITTFFYILTILGVAMLVTALFIKKRG